MEPRERYSAFYRMSFLQNPPPYVSRPNWMCGPLRNQGGHATCWAIASVESVDVTRLFYNIAHVFRCSQEIINYWRIEEYRTYGHVRWIDSGYTPTCAMEYMMQVPLPAWSACDYFGSLYLPYDRYHLFHRCQVTDGFTIDDYLHYNHIDHAHMWNTVYFRRHIKHFISKQAIVMGFDVGDYFTHWPWHPEAIYSRAYEPYLSTLYGHAMVCVGYGTSRDGSQFWRVKN